MKQAILLSLLGIGILSSCSTVYKSGQTPDDVYFSPGRELTGRDEVKLDEEKAQYQDYVSSLDDRYLRMKVASRSRWSTLDDFDYWYDSRYDFNAYNGFNYNYYSSLNPYWNPGYRLGIGLGSLYYPDYGYYAGGYNYGWGWSSPVYTVAKYYSSPYLPAKSGGYTAGSFATAYRNKSYQNSNYGYKDPKTGAFVPSSSNSGFGNLLKRVFSSSSAQSGYANSYDRPVRTFSNTSTPNTNTYTPPATNSNAGGNSGGFKSTGSSTSTGRGGRG